MAQALPRSWQPMLMCRVRGHYIPIEQLLADKPARQRPRIARYWRWLLITFLLQLQRSRAFCYACILYGF